jgi:hypothetical protein
VTIKNGKVEMSDEQSVALRYMNLFWEEEESMERTKDMEAVYGIPSE